jgi:hypothetical protein
LRFKRGKRELTLHPHVHCVIPAGGLSLDHTHWVKSPNRFFLPLKVLSRVFRGKFVAGLKQAFQNRRLNFPRTLVPLAQPKTFAAWLRLLFRKDWVVYAKRPFGGPEYVLQYLDATPIAWPSPTIASSGLRRGRSPSAGATLLTTMNKSS